MQTFQHGSRVWHLLLLALLLAAFFAAPNLRSGDITWTNAAGGDFQDPGNWNSNAVPGTNDRAIYNIVTPDPYTVTWTESVTNKDFYVARGNLVWDLGGYRYCVTNVPNISAESFGSMGQTLNLVISNGALDLGAGSIYRGIVGDSTVRIASNVTGRIGGRYTSPGIESGGRLIVDGATVVSAQIFVNGGGELIVTNGASLNAGSGITQFRPGGMIRIVGANSKFVGAVNPGPINLASTGLLYIAQGAWLSSEAGNLVVLNTNSHMVLDDGYVRASWSNRQGYIEGAGVITGYCRNAGGWVRPGGSNGVGRLRFTSTFHNYNPNPPAERGTIEIELGGPETNQFDRLVISSTFYAGGTLSVSLINGYQPRHGERFDILDFASVSDAFETLSLQSERCWDLSDLYTTGEIRYVAAGTTVTVR